MADVISSLPLTNIQMQPNGVGTVNFGSPQLVNVTFYDKSVLNKGKSQAAGRPVHDLVPFVRIQHPGERDFSDAPVAQKPNTPNIYPAQYAAYQQKRQPAPNGTPVDMLFVQNPEIAANLRGMGVYVIEQLAYLSAEAIGRIGMGAQEWVNKAKRYLETAKQGVEYHQMQKELEKRDTTIDVLKNNIRLLQAQLERLTAQISGTAQPSILPVRNTAPIYQQAAPPVPQFPNDEFQSGVEIADVTIEQPSSGIASYEERAPLITNEDYELPPEQEATTANAPTKKKGGWPKGRPRKARR